MKFQIGNANEIFDKHINGFRIYSLQNPIMPIFVSQNLCELTGYGKERLKSGETDRYADIVHEDDRQVYADLIKKLSESRESSSAEYRIIKSDGSIMFVRDTVSVNRFENGTAVGYAMLTDITELKEQNAKLNPVPDNMPCGIIRYTCEKNPQITYINKQMTDILHFPESREGELDYLELYRDNVYLMIPIEERRRLTHLLDEVHISGRPLFGEMSVLRFDGSKARVYGMIDKVVGEDGREEFRSVCFDITVKYLSGQVSETERYIKALSDVYDRIFEYDFFNRTVKFISGNSDTFNMLRNIPMDMDSSTAQWIETSVCDEDRSYVREFFESFFASRTAGTMSGLPQVHYRARSRNGQLNSYTGTFLKIDANIALFCCRKHLAQDETEILRSENTALKSRNEHIQQMIMRYTDGIAAFEVVDNKVTPLYASDNICGFFGFSGEEWLELMKKSTPIKDFIAGSDVDEERFTELLENGEAEFPYYEKSADAVHLVRAICSEKKADGSAPRYIMLYKMGPSKGTAEKSNAKHDIYIRTFGYFDVFVDDKPIAFRNKKAKELLALLVDRRGGYVTSEEAISCLWEDEAVNVTTLARYRKEALRLKNTLEEYGICNIIESVNGKRRIVPEAVHCDLFDYLSDKEEYSNLFKGSYLTNYAWGEFTLGELSGAVN